MIAKYDIGPDDFYLARTLNAAAIAALPEDVNGKNRMEAEKKLNSNLYLRIGDEAKILPKIIYRKLYFEHFLLNGSLNMSKYRKSTSTRVVQD